jgi:2,4-dienoyl-CoA reductase (NADPH2)
MITEREIRFLAERAKGGAGIVTSGVASIDPEGEIPKVLRAWDNAIIPGLRKCSEAIHSHGALAFFQVGHFGRYSEPKQTVPKGPSVFTSPVSRWGTCRALSTEEVEEIVSAHVEGARRGKEGGFDGVDIIGIAGYLVASFFSPLTNKRTDRYGGSLENRARIGLEIVDGIKSKLGRDFPLIFRVCGSELMDGGSSEEELRMIAQMLEEAGADAISVGVAWHESRVSSLGMEITQGRWLYLAEEMKKVLKVPVMMAYRINNPDIAERALEEGKIDFWESCRQLLADPELPNKLREGHPEDIAPCVACNEGCFSRVWNYQPIWCIINARLGHEYEEGFQIRPARNRKKVLVIGGGPGGMEAARVASLRGHDVTLYERESSLGGQVALAGKTPHRGEMANIVTYLSTQLEKLGVKVNLGIEVTPELVKDLRPQAVIIATGSTPITPSVSGAAGEHVVRLDDALAGKAKIGQRVVIWGGRQGGVQLAELLHAQGRAVTIVEEGDKVCRDSVTTEVMGFRRRLKESNISVLVNTRITRIEPGEVQVLHKEGTEWVVPADTVVAAGRRRQNNGLGEALKGEVSEVYAIGDHLAPRKVRAAIYEGFKAALQI